MGFNWQAYYRKKRQHQRHGGGAGGPVVAPSDPTPAPSLTAPVLRFNSNPNSQLLALLEDF